jgi:hypothetical protein
MGGRFEDGVETSERGRLGSFYRPGRATAVRRVGVQLERPEEAALGWVCERSTYQGTRSEGFFVCDIHLLDYGSTSSGGNPCMVGAVKACLGRGVQLECRLFVPASTWTFPLWRTVPRVRFSVALSNSPSDFPLQCLSHSTSVCSPPLSPPKAKPLVQ